MGFRYRNHVENLTKDFSGMNTHFNHWATLLPLSVLLIAQETMSFTHSPNNKAQTYTGHVDQTKEYGPRTIIQIETLLFR